MPQADSLLLVMLLSAAVGLLLWLLLLVLCVDRRLKRMEKRMDEAGNEGAADGGGSAWASTPGGAFEAFLNEDPARRDLAKGEQFAAYRRWRQERGMNWSQS